MRSKSLLQLSAQHHLDATPVFSNTQAQATLIIYLPVANYEKRCVASLRLEFVTVKACELRQLAKHPAFEASCRTAMTLGSYRNLTRHACQT